MALSKKKNDLLTTFADLINVEAEARLRLSLSLDANDFEEAVGYIDILAKCHHLRSHLLIQSAGLQQKRTIPLVSEMVN